MHRHLSWLFAGILVLFALAILTDLPNSPGFHFGPIDRNVKVVQGLDLQGGIRVLLCTAKHTNPPSSAMSAARDVIENRIGGIGGLTSPQVSVVSSSPPCVDVELPGANNQKAVIKTIGSTGKLVLGGTNVQSSSTQTVAPPGVNEKVKLIAKGQPDASTNPQKVLIVVPGNQVVPNSAAVTFDTSGNPQVTYNLKSAGSTAWCKYTTSHVNYFSPVVLDNKVIADPVIQSAICGGSTQVTGLSLSEANNLKTILNYGALPVSLHVQSIETVSATLGPTYVHKAEIAGIIGLILVALFMLIYYRLPGLIADVALLIYAAVVFALFKFIPVTLTLPGIAGFILSIGMAVDANVLIFERLKEELRAGKSLGAAIDSGFNRAWTSIRDSNISTMITTVILYWFGQHFGTTVITSFASTLFIGVAVSMFTAIVVTRTFLRLLVASGRGRSLWLYGVEDPRAKEPAVLGGSVV